MSDELMLPSENSTGCLQYAITNPTYIPIGDTGIKVDFNCGARVYIPANVNDVKVSFFDEDTSILMASNTYSGERVVHSPKMYYVRWRVVIDYDGLTYTHTLSLNGKDVCFRIGDSGIGDFIAWIPYVNEFCKRHGCKGTVVGNRALHELMSFNYPKLKFIRSTRISPSAFYATYHIGLFRPFDTNREYQFEDPRRFGLRQVAGNILGINEVIDAHLDVDPLDDEREIEGKYVCIATQSTMQYKFWNNPFGWYTVIKYLKSLGYRVICIDKKPITGDGIWKGGGNFNYIPNGCEDFTGDIPLTNRAAMIKHCDFFIGLSSGLSWLAWALGKPVVMISGMTWDYNEFYTPYRVQNKTVCTGCFHWSLMKDYDQCPKYKGKDIARMYECTKAITPKMVIDTINRLIEDQKKGEKDV